MEAKKYVQKNEMTAFCIAGLGQGMIYALMSSYISDYYLNVLTLYGDHVKPTLVDLTATFDSNLDFAACAENDGEQLVVTLRGTNCPHRITYTFRQNGNTLSVDRKTKNNQGYAASFSGKEI